jgi:hypothetical protein
MILPVPTLATAFFFFERLDTAYETSSCSPTSPLVLQLNYYRKAKGKGDRAHVCPGEMMHLNTASTDRTDVAQASKDFHCLTVHINISILQQTKAQLHLTPFIL